MNIDEIIKASRKISNEDLVFNDIDKEILDLCKKVNDQYPNGPWILGVDILDRLAKLGKPNVRNHLEQLVCKNKLESKLYKNRKVYRWPVIE